MSRVNIGKMGLGNVESSLVGAQHDPIIMNFQAKEGNIILKAGTLIAFDTSTGKAEPYTQDNLVGVLTLNCDLAKDDSMNVLVHGSVKKLNLAKADDSTITDEILLKLLQSGIYPF